MKNKKIILGTAQFGRRYGIANTKILTKKNFYKILDLALKKNINYLDTSLNYQNEKLIGNYIKSNEIQNHIKIITKIPSLKSIPKFKITNLLEKSLLNLGINKFDTIFFHDPKDINYVKNNIKYFEKIKKDFNVKNFGFSIYEKKDLNKIKKIKIIDSIQVPINFINEDFSKIKDKNIKIYARSIFLQGLLINKKINYKVLAKNIIESHKNYINYITKEKINPVKFCLEYINSIENCDNYIFGVNSKKHLLDILRYKNSKNYNRKHFTKIKHFFNSRLVDPRKWV